MEIYKVVIWLEDNHPLRVEEGCHNATRYMTREEYEALLYSDVKDFITHYECIPLTYAHDIVKEFSINET